MIPQIAEIYAAWNRPKLAAEWRAKAPQKKP
jgi:hypothetical protein